MDAVGDGVDVDAEYPGGLLEALVLVQVDRQRADQVHLVPGVVVDQGTEHILSELPQLMHVAYLQRGRPGEVSAATRPGRSCLTDRATALMCAGVVPQHPPTRVAPLATNCRAASAKYSVLRA